MTGSQNKRLPPLTDAQFEHWQKLLEERTGICLAQHRNILQQGLASRMRELGQHDYGAYFQHVLAGAEGDAEWSWLAGVISVKETRFLRDPPAFELVTRYLQRLPMGRELHLWSVGCASGEEAYTLAITALDVFAARQVQPYFTVTGLDISAEALAVARDGVYPGRKLEDVPEEWLTRYFTRQGRDRYQVAPVLRQRVGFVRDNLLELESAPRLAMDVIFCQNVLVYFRRERQRQVLDNLAERLRPGGLLVIGASEGVRWSHPAVSRLRVPGVHAFQRRAGQ